jgi:transposase InsO family protein
MKIACRRRSPWRARTRSHLAGGSSSEIPSQTWNQTRSSARFFNTQASPATSTISRRTGQSAPRSRKEGGKGWEYLHLAVDDHSRLAYSEILPDETRRSCLKFLLQALRFFRDHGVKVLRVMTDNGVSFRSHRYAKALRRLKIKHKRTKPYTQEPTERPNASSRPSCGNARQRFVTEGTGLRERLDPAAKESYEHGVQND